MHCIICIANYILYLLYTYGFAYKSYFSNVYTDIAYDVVTKYLLLIYMFL